MQWRAGKLWRNRDFLKLWTGETISIFGSQVTALALPLTAELTLHAEPSQMGILQAASFAPFILVTLFAGIWVDRQRRRPIMILANIGRATLLALIPLCAFLTLLRIEYLYAIAFSVGTLTVLFELASISFLPSLVGHEQIVEANSKLQTTSSAASIGGQSLAGVLIELATAPFAILANVLSFFASVLGMTSIRKPEPPPSPTKQPNRRNFPHEIAEGLRIVFGNSYLRSLAFEAATYNMFEQAILTVFYIFTTRELGIEPGILGLIFAINSVGALLGSWQAAHMARRIGLGLTIVTSMIIACSTYLLVPLANESIATMVLLTSVFFINGIGVAISNVHVVSLRQTIIPSNLQGRMNASYRFLVSGSIPIGALLGGFLGEIIGLRLTIAVCATGLLFALPWVLFSPVIRLRQPPALDSNAITE